MHKCRYEKGCNEWVIKNEDELCYYHKKLEAGLLDATSMEDLFITEPNMDLELFFEK